MTHEDEPKPDIWRAVDQDLARFEHARRTSNREYANSLTRGLTTILPPHCIALFGQSKEYRIAQGSLTPHQALQIAYNEERDRLGLDHVTNRVSGQVFSFKNNRDKHFIRLDTTLWTVGIDTIVDSLIDQGYEVLDPEYKKIERSIPLANE